VSLDSTVVDRDDKECAWFGRRLMGLEQNFNIKTFVGTSAKALKTQVWTARSETPKEPLDPPRGPEGGWRFHSDRHRGIIPAVVR